MNIHPIAAMIKEHPAFKKQDLLIDINKRLELGFPFIFGMWLADTPYSQGEQKLAGWNSADDFKKARSTKEGNRW